MAVVYLGISVELHGLELKKESHTEVIREQIENFVRNIHPSLNYDSDVCVEIMESTGKYE